MDRGQDPLVPSSSDPTHQPPASGFPADPVPGVVDNRGPATVRKTEFCLIPEVLGAHKPTVLHTPYGEISSNYERARLRAAGLLKRPFL